MCKKYNAINSFTPLRKRTNILERQIPRSYKTMLTFAAGWGPGAAVGSTGRCIVGRPSSFVSRRHARGSLLIVFHRCRRAPQFPSLLFCHCRERRSSGVVPRWRLKTNSRGRTMQGHRGPYREASASPKTGEEITGHIQGVAVSGAKITNVDSC